MVVPVCGGILVGRPIAGSLARSVFLCTCPACGVGRLYKSYLKPSDSCTHCGLKIADYDAADGPAYTVMFLVGIIVTIAAVYVEFHYTVPLGFHLMVWPLCILVLSLALLPSVKALFMVWLYRLKLDQNA